MAREDASKKFRLSLHRATLKATPSGWYIRGVFFGNCIGNVGPKNGTRFVSRTGHLRLRPKRRTAR